MASWFFLKSKGGLFSHGFLRPSCLTDTGLRISARTRESRVPYLVVQYVHNVLVHIKARGSDATSADPDG